MILADTNIWIDHLRRSDQRLASLLEEDDIAMHPWVLGELAEGTLTSRAKLLSLMSRLPTLRPAKDEAILRFIESARLFGRGLGWVDAGLLASCAAGACLLWTRDARLRAAAADLGLAAGD